MYLARTEFLMLDNPLPEQDIPQSKDRDKRSALVTAKAVNLSDIPTLEGEDLSGRKSELREAIEKSSPKTISDFIEIIESPLKNPGVEDSISFLRRIPGNQSRKIDRSSWDLLEMDALFLQVVDLPLPADKLISPSIVAVYQQFSNPPTTELEWSSKQEAIKKLITDDKLFSSTKKLYQTIEESKLDKIFKKLTWEDCAGEWNSEVLDSLRQVKKVMQGSLRTGTDYLDTILNLMQESTHGHLFQLAEEGIAFSPKGIIPRSKGSFWKYVRPYAPFRADLATVGLTFGGAAVAAMNISANPSLGALLAVITGTAMAIGGGISILALKPDRVITKYLRNSAVKDPDIANLFQGLGRLQEILSWAEYARKSALPTCFSERKHSSSFSLKAKGMGNTLEANNRKYVLNDLELDNKEIRALSGPNGGGKSALERSIAYNIWTSEVACIATAKEFTYTPPEKIIAHTPTVDMQFEGISRFQREVAGLAKAIENIEVAKKPVLLLLDEMFSSTAENEAAEEAVPQFAYLFSLDNSPAVVIATHNRPLINILIKGGIAKPLRMRWAGGKPAFIVEEGLSETSYASRVIEEAGIDKASLVKRLESKEIGDPERFTKLLKKMQSD